MNNKEKYHDLLNSGEIYDSVDSELIEYQRELVKKISEFNHTSETPEGHKKREKILREVLGTYNEGLYIICSNFCKLWIEECTCWYRRSY
ncbi:maltose acetyltransferase domain-containing protein [Enterococcus mundtii]|uniref:maltose acetyltransferase domain-containing protein n=1 Tax=Enterococcus mundtii TaxID=53346 RepID=UPI0020CD76DC|nr:maltose acetyltransferase domain-containing protein [Enterococcus mundtii]